MSDSKGWVDKYFYIHCGCFSMTHDIRVSFWKEEIYRDEDANHSGDTFYIHYYLPTGKWYKRIWLALKYVFGFRSEFGEFGETIMHRGEASRLAAFLKDPEGTAVETTKE